MTTHNMHIRKKVYFVVEKFINNPSIDVNDNSDFSLDFGMKSFEALELIAEIESTLNIKIPDESVEKIKTVGDLVREIETL